MKKLLLLFALLLLPLCTVRAWNIEDALGVKIGMSKPQFKTAMRKTLVPINEWMRKLYPDLDTLTVDKDENGNYKIEILHQQQLGARIPSTLFLPVSADDIFKFGVTISTIFKEDKLSILSVRYDLNYSQSDGRADNPSSLFSFLSCLNGWVINDAEPYAVKETSLNHKSFYFTYPSSTNSFDTVVGGVLYSGSSSNKLVNYYMADYNAFLSVMNSEEEGE